MNTTELEAQKAGLARIILSESDESIIRDVRTFIEKRKRLSSPTDPSCGKRNIGMLDGKAFFSEEGDGKISVEEFLGL